MIKDVLEYTWARNKLLTAVDSAVGSQENWLENDQILAREFNLSQRITELVSDDSFDRYRANLMHARSVAYWREWLTSQSDSVEKTPVISLDNTGSIYAALSDFAAFSF